MTRPTLFIAAVLLALALVACGGGETNNGATPTVDWNAFSTACANGCPTAAVLPIRPANATVEAQMTAAAEAWPPTATPPLPTMAPALATAETAAGMATWAAWATEVAATATAAAQEPTP